MDPHVLTVIGQAANTANENEVSFFFVVVFLFVRYMGVVGVLSTLMVGMFISGRVFTRLRSREAGEDPENWRDKAVDGVILVIHGIGWPIRMISQAGRKVFSRFDGLGATPSSSLDHLSDEALLAGEVHGGSAEVDPEVIAAITLAIHLHTTTHRPSVRFATFPSQSASPWAVSGRFRQLGSHTFK